jgi:hypothetical protein
MIGDDWSRRLPEDFPWVYPQIIPNTEPVKVPYIPMQPVTLNPPTREEFERLTKEVEALKDLLKAAKIYDEKTGQKDCEMDAKVNLIKKIADAVGVDLEDVFGKK